MNSDKFRPHVTNNYLQNLAVEFTNEPETGSITVNGVDFAIGASPQLIVLDNLDSDGLPVDVIVSFTDNPSCTATFSSAFTAPALCFCPTDFNGDGTTDIQDFLGFLGNFGCSDCAEDLNGSGVAGSDDLLIFLGGFGLACP